MSDNTKENIVKEKIDVKKEIFEWIYSIAIAIIIALLIRYFIFTPTMVRQSSMYPTLIDGERLFLSRMIRNVKGMPKRGEIITFEEPQAIGESLEKPIAYYHEINSLTAKFVKYFLEIGKRSFIKRVIALPGEKIEILNGKVYINGEILDEPYLVKDLETTMGNEGKFYSLTVPENCVFVMGDNRTGSSDSRVFGCIPINKIEGKVLFRIWPLNKFGKI